MSGIDLSLGSDIHDLAKEYAKRSTHAESDQAQSDDHEGLGNQEGPTVGGRAH